jgi:hypothetical protein
MQTARKLRLDYAGTIVAIARDIERTRVDFPQLSEFRVERNCDTENLTIRYGFKTHELEDSDGWMSRLPNPDHDGVWFHFDLHDPESREEIHNLAFLAKLHFGKKAATLLLLEGWATKSFNVRLEEIIRRNGIRPGVPSITSVKVKPEPSTLPGPGRSNGHKHPLPARGEKGEKETNAPGIGKLPGLDSRGQWAEVGAQSDDAPSREGKDSGEMGHAGESGRSSSQHRGPVGESGRADGE